MILFFTHSRPKAAARSLLSARRCRSVSTHSRPKAAAAVLAPLSHLSDVSTHSRPKAAASMPRLFMPPKPLFQHTAARRRLRSQCGQSCRANWAFQHTAARRRLPDRRNRPARYAQVSTHSRPKAAACAPRWPPAPPPWFQHTAARRRLPVFHLRGADVNQVSTHSRPKAAASVTFTARPPSWRFNTQPPEGGCKGRQE